MVKFWLQYVELQGLSNDDLDIYFKTIGDVKKEENSKVEVHMFNLSEATIAIFETGKIATLNAGYRDDHGVIFRGMVEKKRTEVVGSDVATYITLKQVEHPKLRTKIQGVIPKGYTIEKAVRMILDAIGIPIEQIEATGKVLERAREFETQTAIQLIVELTKEVDGFEFFTRDNKAFFIKHGSGKVEGYFISYKTGLLEIKAHEESPGEYDEATEGQGGGGGVKSYSVKTLLLWKIRQGSLIGIESPIVSGTMKVLNYTHTSSKADFITEMEVKPV